jgi:hypothetical protein
MRRRQFIRMLGGAVAWPLAARGQQAPPPVIGILDSGSPDADGDRMRAYRKGLSETGYVASFAQGITLHERGESPRESDASAPGISSRKFGRCDNSPNELTPSHSITSSALTTSDDAIVRPISFAVFRLMASASFMG